MQFSRVLTQRLSVFSPNGLYVAGLNEQHINVRNVETLTVVASFVSLSKADILEWSLCSMYLLCLSSKTIQIFSLENPDWSCRIIDDDVGFKYVCWLPDSNFIFSVSDFEAWSNIWSLKKHSLDGMPLLTILKPKPNSTSLAISENKSFFALLTRENLKDFANIYSCNNWHLFKRFNVSTFDAEGVLWANNDKGLIIWDSPLACKILVYSTIGDLIKSYQPYTNALGVSCVAINKAKNLVAIAFYDKAIRLISCSEWNIEGLLKHEVMIPITQVLDIFEEKKVKSSNSLIIKDKSLFCSSEEESIYVPVDLEMKHRNFSQDERKGKIKEKDDKTIRNSGNRVIDYGDGIHFYKLALKSMRNEANVHKKMEVCNDNTFFSLSLFNPVISTHGISALAWSHDSLYLASKSEEYPEILYIWNVERLNLVCLLSHMKSIKDFKWKLTEKDNYSDSVHELVIVTGDWHVFLWSPNRCAVVEIPSNSTKQKLSCIKVNWNSIGKSLLLQSHDKSCIAYLDNKI